MDPAAIASCIPGCENLEPDGVDRYSARLTIGIAAITGNYEGTVTIRQGRPPSYKLTVEGQGRPGSSKAKRTITLRDRRERRQHDG